MQGALYLLLGADLISKGRNNSNSNWYKLLKYTDVTACMHENHIFLCEGLTHCLKHWKAHASALYIQSERGVRENSKLEQKPLRETIFQVLATDHLVISSYPHTAQILCQNSTQYPIWITTMARLHLSLGCTLQLFNHTLWSDQSICIKAEPLVF